MSLTRSSICFLALFLPLTPFFGLASLRADSEMIHNGDFHAGTKAWTLDRLHGAQAALKVEPGEEGKLAAHVEVTAAAADQYSVQLFQGKFSLVSEKTYHLKFRARSQPGAKIGLNLMVAESPWTTLWVGEVELTPEWKDFSFDIAPSASADNARITFTRLGAQAAGYWFTSVSLTGSP